MMVCPAGHLAKYREITKRSDTKRKNDRLRFIFDRNKCAVCSHAEQCGFKGGRYGRQYTVSLLTQEQEKQLKEQETQAFKEKYKERYIIEAKNSELKHPYHMDRAISYGLDAFTLQGAVAIFTSNLVRINTILTENSKK